MAKEKKKLPLAAYIFAGLVLGILAGAALMKTPEIAVEYIKPFGTLFSEIHCSADCTVLDYERCDFYAGHAEGWQYRGENRLLLYVHNGDGSADWSGDCEPLQGIFPSACDIGTGI